MASSSTETMSIASSSFYGENRSQLNEDIHSLPATELALPQYLSDPLLGPCKVWKIFRKQQNALDFILHSNLKGEVHPFSYESVNFERLFLVAHPDIFWYRDCQKKTHLRNTYEIITTDAVCKLYFDLEFDKTIEENRICDGDEMVKTLIRVVMYYIGKLFLVKYKMKDVLILDSTTKHKFSVHLIFQTPLVFYCNQDAGNFVKFIAKELININNVCSDEEQMQFDIFKETTINIYSIKDLFVMNKNQNRILFMDLAVYTRNRLFRLYRSTKKSRNAPLILSSINKFSLDSANSLDPVQLERKIFLSSLITYFTHPPDPALIKTFDEPTLDLNYSTETKIRRLQKLLTAETSPTKSSPYVELDNFIRNRIQPRGHIFRSIHFPSTNVTVYDIKGYRYCGNIRRWHKSQNIKFVVDVARGVFYQKCHDMECATYKSPEWPLPPELLFKISLDEADDMLEAVDMDVLDMERRNERCDQVGNGLENENIAEKCCSTEESFRMEANSSRQEESCSAEVASTQMEDSEGVVERNEILCKGQGTSRRMGESCSETEDREGMLISQEEGNVRVEHSVENENRVKTVKISCHTENEKSCNIEVDSRCIQNSSQIQKENLHKTGAIISCDKETNPSLNEEKVSDKADCEYDYFRSEGNNACEKKHLGKVAQQTCSHKFTKENAIKVPGRCEKSSVDTKCLPACITQKEDQDMVLAFVQHCEKDISHINKNKVRGYQYCKDDVSRCVENEGPTSKKTKL